jgi:soluble lytic murein transglycosylase-like protein
MTIRRGLRALALLPCLAIAIPMPAAGDPAGAAKPAGTITESLCQTVDSAASASHVPVALLTRLLWRESRFQAGATSPKGAEGIAQFMPGTAAEHSLADPFDPEQAIPKAARLLAEYHRRFGNLGLAAAAYNAGPDRVAHWLAGSATLPAETQAYVFAITGRPADDWAKAGRQIAASDDPVATRSCVETTAELRTVPDALPAPIAPWGVQLSGNFSKAIALASFARTQQRYFPILGNVRPMILGRVLRSRGRLPFYRVLAPAASRADADRLCDTILAKGGACVALRT